MKIEIHNTRVHADIIIGEDADAYDCVDAFIGAMIIEGYDIKSVHRAFQRRTKGMEGIGDEI